MNVEPGKAKPRRTVESAKIARDTRKARPGRGGGAKDFPIVGVGASAGGLEAFTQLLKNLPVDSGMAFVLVQHLDPDHPSALTQLLETTTRMAVHEVTQGTRVEPNHVYVIPENTSMVIEQGVLKLQPRAKMPGAQRTIDLFLESLARDQRERAIGIILSGTATDGTQGLEMIKAEGGITLAQDESAKFDSMPRSAVAAGCVDFVLSPKGMGKELARIAAHPLVAAGRHANTTERVTTRKAARRLSTGAPTDDEAAATDPGADGAFRKILLALRNQCGVDFSNYKPNTLQRRVARRMVLNHQTTQAEYAQFLKGNPKEISLLYADVLIGVTSFFRNADAFEALKQKVFPALLQQPRRDDPVRIWTVACSTGQEAYSMAMAFTEYCDKWPRAPQLQLFATDLNEASLDKARRGFYTRTMVADVSPERLRRFFVEEQGGYRICKSLRDACVFARQNIFSDPPFSRMDVISCRNLLIYLELGLQRTILPNFHYALKPGGFLFLGASESIGSFTEFFSTVDKKHKLYARKAAPAAFHLPVGQPGNDGTKTGRTANLARSVPPGPSAVGPARDLPSDLGQAQRMADRVSVNRFAPPGVLINADLQILQFRGVTSAYLEQPAGKPSFDILKLAREGLMLPLRAAINKAKKGGKTTRAENVPVKRHGQSLRVNVEVIPLRDLQERCFLILFEDLAWDARGPSNTPATEHAKASPSGRKFKESTRTAELERELAETRDYLQSIQEQHDAATQELQSSTEEVQSANEELQSANEELETSKEELESTNEELTTVNEEMASRNTELNRVNGDLVNLQASTKLAIVLLGRDLTIRRFTSQAQKQFKLLASDEGRSFANIRHNLDLPDLDEFLAGIIASGHEREREVRDKDGRWFSLRARPYLTLDNKVDGAVLVLVDIDELKKKEGLISEGRGQAETIIRTVPDPLVILNADLRIHSANEAFYRAFKVTPAETEDQLLAELGHGSWNNPKLFDALAEIIPKNSFFDDLEVAHTGQGIGRRTFHCNARALNATAGKPKQILVGLRDITVVLTVQAELRQSEDRYRTLFNSIDEGFCVIEMIFDTPGEATDYRFVEVNPSFEKHTGIHAATGKRMREIAPDTEAFWFETYGKVARSGEPVRFVSEAKALHGWFDVYAFRLGDEKSRRVAVIFSNITERMTAEAALRRARVKLADRANQLEQAVTERTADLAATNKQLEAFVYSIAHDLRAPLRSMQGFSDLLVEEVGGLLSQTGRDFAQRISASAQFLDALLRDLIAFSGISEQRIELAPVPLDAMAQLAISCLEKEIREKNARVEALGDWPTVVAHEATLGPVFMHLVSNALKFVAPNVRPIVRLRTEERGVFIRVWVEDNGIGITPHHQEQIYRLFTRLHGEKYPGTGVGLAMVKKGIERMGGQVGVESTPGQGSRFWFELRKA